MNPILLAVLFGIGWAPFFLLRAESMRDALPHYGRRRAVLGARAAR